MATPTLVPSGPGMTSQNLSNVTVTIGDLKIDAYSAHAGIAALPTEIAGMPAMGTVEPNFSLQVDLNNQSGETYSTIKELFELCKNATKDKIKPIKFEFWKDQAHQDVHIALNFEGWVTSWHISSGYGHNHVLGVSVQPKLDSMHYMVIRPSN